MKNTVALTDNKFKLPKLNIRFDCYPYGKITKRLKESVQWLNKNKKNIFENYIFNESEAFNYPNYGGLPSKLSNKLTTGEVVWIQEEIGFRWEFAYERWQVNGKNEEE